MAENWDIKASAISIRDRDWWIYFHAYITTLNLEGNDNITMYGNRRQLIEMFLASEIIEASSTIKMVFLCLLGCNVNETPPPEDFLGK